MKFPITWVEVFAQQPMTGSLLPVIHHVDQVETQLLAKIARRFLQAETSFTVKATRPNVDYRHRIFTVHGEIPFAGHPSLGCAAAVTHLKGVSESSYVQQTLSGTQQLQIRLHDREGHASMVQNNAEFGQVVSADAILKAVGLTESVLHPTLKPQTVSTGLPVIIVPIDSIETLSEAKLDRADMYQALQPIGDAWTLNVYLVAQTMSGHWRARSFALDLGGGEDPATGSAAGPFGAYLKHHLGVEKIQIDQGLEMGMPSRLFVDVSNDIIVSGQVRIVGDGYYDIPV